MKLAKLGLFIGLLVYGIWYLYSSLFSGFTNFSVIEKINGTWEVGEVLQVDFLEGDFLEGDIFLEDIHLQAVVVSTENGYLIIESGDVDIFQCPIANLNSCLPTTVNCKMNFETYVQSPERWKECL